MTGFRFMQSDAARITTRHQTGSRRCAHWTGRIEIGEAHPLACQLVDPRRPIFLRAIATEIPVAEVVTKDDDEIGLVSEKRGTQEQSGDRQDLCERHIVL